MYIDVLEQGCEIVHRKNVKYSHSSLQYGWWSKDIRLPRSIYRDSPSSTNFPFRVQPSKSSWMPPGFNRRLAAFGFAATDADWEHGGGFSLDAAVRIEATDRKGLESQAHGGPCLARRGCNACFGIVPARCLRASGCSGRSRPSAGDRGGPCVPRRGRSV